MNCKQLVFILGEIKVMSNFCIEIRQSRKGGEGEKILCILKPDEKEAKKKQYGIVPVFG